jgi:hypothetical protein
LSNPGFELVANGLPCAWDIAGNWYFPTTHPHDGKRCAATDIGPKGASLLSQCYLLVQKGSKVTASAYYRSDAASLDLGVEFCDETGGHISWSTSETAPAAADWTPISRNFTITDELWSAGVRSVRVRLQVTTDRPGLALDDISLSADGLDDASGFCTLPQIDAAKLPNIAPNAALRGGGGSVPGWEPLVCDGASADCAICDPSGGLEGNSALRVNASATVAGPVGWRSKPVAVDLSLPYRLTASLHTKGLAGGSAVISLQLCDASGNAVLCSAQAPPLGADVERKGVVVEVPAIYKTPRPGNAVIRLAVCGKTTGSIWADGIQLTPVPISLGIRAIPTGNVFHKARDVAFFVSSPSNVDRIIKPTVHIKVLDLWGKQVQYEKRQMAIAPRAAAFYPVRPKITRNGHYTLVIRMIENGVTLAFGTADFALTDAPEASASRTLSAIGSVDTGASDDALDLARDARCAWLRETVAWEDVEPTPGHFDYSRLDKVLSSLSRREIAPVIAIGGGPSWLDAGVAAARFETLCTRLAQRCCGSVTHYEIGAGFSGTLGSLPADKLAELIKAGARGLRKGSPDCKVVVTTPDSKPETYDALLASGVGDAADVIGVPVSRDVDESTYRAVREALTRHNLAAKPIWGVGCPAGKRVDAAASAGPAQAAVVAKSCVAAMAAGCERVAWFALVPYYDPRVSEYDPGALLSADQTVTPAWTAYQNAASLLGSAKFEKWLELGPDAKCAVFSDGDTRIAAIWATGDAAAVKLSTDADSVEIRDVVGGRNSVTVLGGQVGLQAREDPQFVIVKGSLGAG